LATEAIDSTARTADWVGVRSRVAWQAIIAGSALALSLYLLLALLGAAIGFSVGDRASTHNIGTGAAVYAIAATAVCLFLGGYVASQLTTGENKVEGALYGIFVWAAVFALLLWLTASGVRVGFNAMVGVAAAGTVAADNTRPADWEALAERNGITRQQIEEAKQRAKDAPAKAQAAAQDPQNQQEAADAATRVAWYAFLGAWLSMMAAAAGGYFGSGPALRVFSVWSDRNDYDRRSRAAHA
jgi:hypothetical protein